jgi:signal transduction histidine kinase
VAVVRTNAELLDRHLEAKTLGQPNDGLAVRDILAETERLGKMVEQMLTLAQADAGQAIVSTSTVALNEVAEDAARSIRALAEAKGVALTVQTTGNTWVHGDGGRLREVMMTLLDNAVKYTPPGGAVDLSVRQDHKWATVAVSDTGAGIPAESLKHIFKRFYRVDKARSRDEGGTGLGLAIARHIVDAHNGEIHIQSDVGEGTTVTVQLRLLTGEAARDISRLPSEAEM